MSTPRSSAVSPALASLRQSLDTVDDQIHDLLMKRAEIVGEIRAYGDKGPVKLRPGREASILRRLLARHKGDLPDRSVVLLWREIFAGSLAMQGGFSLGVGDQSLINIARQHFGWQVSMQVVDPVALLASIALGDIGLGLLPWGDDASDWWNAAPFISQSAYMVASLPFDGAQPLSSMLISSQAPDPSGDDRSILLLPEGVAEDQLLKLGYVDPVIRVIGNDWLADVAGYLPAGPAAVGQCIGAYAKPPSLSQAPAASLFPVADETP